MIKLSCSVELGVGNGNFVEDIRLFRSGEIWAYDTFDRQFPLSTLHDDEDINLAQIIGSEATPDVLKRLSESGVICVVGLFPESFNIAHPDSVDFVHVDMDTYSATSSGLNLFSRLMIKGGTFLVHDYDNFRLRGVKRATDEFIQSEEGKKYSYQRVKNDHLKLVKISC